MGSIIDMERVETTYRCNHVKKAVIFINLIGAPISLIVLLYFTITILISKKKSTFLTIPILLIFSSEIINLISKLFQLIKYFYRDERNDKTFTSENTPRGIICQIQIITSIYSDFSSLFAILLMSLRIYSALKNGKRYITKKRNPLITIILTVISSLILSILFLILDKLKSDDNLSYRYDTRDRCTYWCWLDHSISQICCGLYWIILIMFIYRFHKINSNLKFGLQKLSEENNNDEIEQMNNFTSNLNDVLNEFSKDNNLVNISEENTGEKNFSELTKEEKAEKIEDFAFIKKLCLIIPMATIIIWIFLSLYRIMDDIIMNSYDNGNDPDANESEEKVYFTNHKFLQFLIQFSLVIHTVISATKGIFYGFSLIIFEEEKLFNIIRKFFVKKSSLIKENIEGEGEEEEDKKGLLRNTNNSSNLSDENNDDKDNIKEEEKIKND